MHRKNCSAPILILAMMALVAPATAQEFDPTKVKGDLQKIREPVANLFKLKTRGGRLVAEFVKDRQTAYQHVGKINSIGGNRGGGSSSSGSRWEIRINSLAFEGFCNYGYSRIYSNTNPETWMLKIKELKKPSRTLLIKADPDGALGITLYGGENPYLLRIRQLKSGSIFVQEISDTQIFSESAPSFDVFCRRYSVFTQNRLLPVIRHIGIDAPMTQFDKDVQKAVLTFLTPIEKQRLDSFQTSFSNLDSADYDKRQSDARKLSESFQDWQDLVMKAINDSEFSFEVRFRLLKVLEEKGKPEDVRASRFAISTDLANNPQYLIWLYENNKDPGIHANIISQLRSVTGDDLGDQIAAWKEKYNDSVGDAPWIDAQPPVDLLAEKGGIDQVAKFVGQLVRLKNADDRIVLDRGYWAEQFGGKSIQELVRETNNRLKQLNMPATYDPDPQFELTSVGHPHAIFARMRSEMQKTQKSSTVYYYSYNRTSSSSLNRTFTNNEIEVSMEFEPNKNVAVRRTTTKNLDVKPPKLDDKPFRIRLVERKDAMRTMLVEQQPDGHLRVSLVTEKSNAFVQFIQKSDGEFVVQDVRGDEIFTAKATNFSEFYDQNRVYCRTKLFPVFAKLGIRFEKKIFDPPPESKPENQESSTSNPKPDNSTKSSNLRREVRPQNAIQRIELAIPRAKPALPPKRK